MAEGIPNRKYTVKNGSSGRYSVSTVRDVYQLLLESHRTKVSLAADINRDKVENEEQHLHKYRTLARTPWTTGVPDNIHGEATVTSWRSANGKAYDEIEGITSSVRIIQIPEVTTYPPYRTWVSTPRNFIIEDRSDAGHMPYFDDAGLEGDPEDDVTSKIYSDLNEGEDKLSEILLESDEAFYGTVLELVKLNVTRAGDGDDADGEVVITSLQEHQAFLNPPMDMFVSLSKVLAPATAEELREKFQFLIKRWPLKLNTAAGNLDDDSVTKQQKVKETMDSYKQLFCRKCFLYNCFSHATDYIASEYIPKIQFPLMSLRSEPCSSHCYRLGVFGNNGTSWTPNDTSFYRALVPVFKNQYCDIAVLMMKSCREVYFCSFFEKAKSPSLSVPSMSTPNPKSEQGGGGPTKQRKTKKATPSRNVCANAKGSDFGGDFEKIIYRPCFHPGADCAAEICVCFDSNIPCEKYCTCPVTCVQRAVGCKCSTRCNKKSCPCFVANRECDPDLCKACGACYHPDSGKKPTCLNIGIQRGWSKHLKLSVSTIPNAGWGIFAYERILKGELIDEYSGELISDNEAERRAWVDQVRCNTYLFDLNSEYTVDAKLKGSKIRFANHKNKPNTIVRLMKVNTDQRLGVYAAKDIEKEQEIFVAYKNVIEDHQKMKSGRKRTSRPSKTVCQSDTASDDDDGVNC